MNAKAARIILDGAWEAYVEKMRVLGDDPVNERLRTMIPLDRRCPGCGVERDGCDRPLCSRMLSEAEE